MRQLAWLVENAPGTPRTSRPLRTATSVLLEAMLSSWPELRDDARGLKLQLSAHLRTNMSAFRVRTGNGEVWLTAGHNRIAIDRLTTRFAGREHEVRVVELPKIRRIPADRWWLTREGPYSQTPRPALERVARPPIAVG